MTKCLLLSTKLDFSIFFVFFCFNQFSKRHIKTQICVCVVCNGVCVSVDTQVGNPPRGPVVYVKGQALIKEELKFHLFHPVEP